MKSIRPELQRLPEFVRWRSPLLVCLLAIREILRPIMYWFIFDIFETDLHLPLAESYAKDKLDVTIYGGDTDLKRAVEDLTSMDDLRPADIALRSGCGDIVAVATRKMKLWAAGVLDRARGGLSALSFRGAAGW